MRAPPVARRTLLSALIGLAGSAALFAGAAPATGSIQAAPRPTLAVLDLSPLVVGGAHFKSNERVRVVATVPGPNLQRSVRTDATGRFRLNFHRTIACSSSLVVFAYGARGSRALRIVPPGSDPTCGSAQPRPRQGAPPSGAP